ncbi:MAG: hypothetical protein ABIJ08_03225, partial [Nanoarchaeota archaeon]
MKKKIISIITLLLYINIANAYCENYLINPLYEYNNETCNNLHAIRISDNCSKLPAPGDCWEPYRSSKLILPPGLHIEENETLRLERFDPTFEWFEISCDEPNLYKIEILFDDKCKRELILNLTEPKEEKLNIEKYQEQTKVSGSSKETTNLQESDKITTETKKSTFNPIYLILA